MKNGKLESFEKGYVLSETELEVIAGGGEDGISFIEALGLGLASPISATVAGICSKNSSGKIRAGLILGDVAALGALVAVGGAIGIGLEHGVKKIVKLVKKSK